MADLRKSPVLAGIGLAILLSSILAIKFGSLASIKGGSFLFPAASAATVTNTASATTASSATDGLTTVPTTALTLAPADASSSVSSSVCAWPPPFSHWGFTVAATYRWPVRLNAGDTLEAEFVIGDGKDIKVRVEDPRGNRIYDPGKVTASHSFQTTVWEAGVYRMIFEKDCFFCTRAIESNYRIY